MEEQWTNNEHITALVSGANRGLGRQFAQQLLDRGAKVYAGARRPESVDLPGAIPVQLDITDPETNTALHGLLCAAEYECVAHSESSVSLAAPIKYRDGYPFDLETTVRYRLTTTGLAATHTVRNVGSRWAPVALGAHPFLSIGDVPVDRLTLRVNGGFHVDVDEQRIPVGVTPVSGTAWDLRTGRPVAELDLDDCWLVSTDAHRGSTHTLCSPDGRTLSLWADGRFGFLHVFVTREFPKDGEHVTAVALEPMTAQADALNSGIGLRWLAPMERFSASWAIRYGPPR